ncbi:O-antigen ligase family protein [Pinibacter aurantiacus]|uniref:O-antigen ligase family protein n=1 Tax=Pinibacter aurantiacus TaxID=2851599 RepID=UPI001C38905E|nr:O-antigen ligase family protein [Pinibacter aurantiacus]
MAIDQAKIAKRPIVMTKILYRNNEKIITFFSIASICSAFSLTIINSITVILFFVYWLLFVDKEFSKNTFRSKAMLLYILLYSVLVVGLFYTSNLTEGFRKIQQQSPLLILPLIFGTLPSKYVRINFSAIAKAFVISVFLFMLFALGYGLSNFYQSGDSDVFFAHSLLLFSDWQPVGASLAALVAIQIIGFNFFDNAATLPRKKKLLSLLLIFFFFILILLLANRTVVVCLFFTIAAFTLKFKSYRKSILFFFLITSLITSAAAIYTPKFKSQVIDALDFSPNNTIPLDTDSSLRGWGGKAIRIALWKCSFDVIKAHPIIGVGTGDAMDSLSAACENRKFYFASRYNKYNSHNQYLENTLKTGIVGLLILITTFLIPFFKKDKSAVTYLGKIFAVCFILCCVTDTMLDLNKTIILYSFFSSIFTLYIPKENWN